MEKPKDLIIQGYDMIGTPNPWNAPEVELWVGDYKNSDFILGRVYEGEYKDDDGETYYNSFHWEFHRHPKDENNYPIDESVIVDLIDEMDFDTEYENTRFEDVVNDF